jgi:eukaryotic-like serine/threonine-protein kinase
MKGRDVRPPDDQPTTWEGAAAVKSPSDSGSSQTPEVSPSDSPTIFQLPSDAPTIAPEAPRIKAPASQDSDSGGLTLLRPGYVLGRRYEIVQLLGQGGMGAVYRALDREVNRTVALKVIRPDLAGNTAILDRFKLELVLSHQVTHKNVVRIYDLGDADGIKFITMEYIEGQDLRSLILEHKIFQPEEAVEIIGQVCKALGAAHSVGVIHRDLKPQNIMRDKTGRIVVMDFGLARLLDSTDGMTQTGAIVGTMEYMSPEQGLGKPLDERSDLFAVGLIFYELLTGQMPYKADSALASLLKRTHERAVPASSHSSTIPRALSDVVGKCLEPKVEDRYQHVSEILADLEAWQGGRAAATLHFPSSSRPWGQTIPWHWIGAVAALLVMVAVTAWYFSKRQNATVVAHAPVSVLVADFQNNTSDTLFDDTLEPMFNVALEGASFVNAFNRGNARQLAGKLPNPTSKLDEKTARLVAVNQGLGAIVTGSLSSQGTGYKLSVKAIDAVTGKALATADVDAANKDDLLLAVPKLAAPIRKALGDTTPESVQVEKTRGALTAASLEVVHQYGIGMEQLFAGNSEEALKSFSNAIALDPNFGRAYAGMAAASENLSKTKDAEKYVKLAMEHVDRMTDRERYRVRGLYYFATSNWQKCIDEYGDLVKRFPADDIAQMNLAGCYVSLRKTPEAIAAAQRAVEIVPKGALQRVILSFQSSYGGDFAAGEREARTALGLNPSFLAYLALAEAQLGLGQMSQATETYHKLETVNAMGASLAASGLADVASYEGRYGDAARILEQGVAADLNAKNVDNAAEKLAALAQLQLLRGQKGPAVAAATKALSTSQLVPVRVLAARNLLEAGEIATAQKLADGLGSELEPETQAYAKIIRGDLALQRGDKNEAIKMFIDANQLLDTWIGRFELGRAYLEAGLFVEADSEFDRCVKRRGEALEIFMDNFPTYAYFPLVHYYQGRVREGLKSSGFAESYRAYLSIRGKAGEDPLLADIHRRLGQ